MDEYYELHDAKLELCCVQFFSSLHHKPSIRFLRQFGDLEVQMMEGTKFIKINYCPFCGERFNIIDHAKSLPF